MFSFGFYNSKNEDRMYNASHFGKIFDGVIQDGVFGTIKGSNKTPFQLEPTDTPSLSAKINKGKAWLGHTWNLLDSTGVLTFDAVSQPSTKRTDAVCIEVNQSHSESGFTPRTNRIVIVKGTSRSASSSDAYPVLTDKQIKNSADEIIIWRFPIAYVTIYGSNYNTTTASYKANLIEGINITSSIQPIGASDAEKYKTWTPLVTGATMDVTDYIPSLSEFQNSFNNMIGMDQATFNTWFDDLKNTVVIDSSAQAALTRLNDKIDNKILYGTTEPPSTLDIGQVYFQIED